MSFWRHDEYLTGRETLLGLGKNDCPFCESMLHSLDKRQDEIDAVPVEVILNVCQVCGWWNLSCSQEGSWRVADYMTSYLTEIRYIHGSLRNFETGEPGIPLDDVRRLLLAEENELQTLHPRLVEEIIDDVFRNLGYKTKLTPKVKDGGVDIFLYPKDQEVVWGVEVKRQKSKVGVSLLRAFLTSLRMEDATYGYFFSTSGFTSGAKDLSLEAPSKGLARVELLEPDWLFDRLRLGRAERYQGLSDVGEVAREAFLNIDSVPVVHKISEDIPDFPW